MGIDFSKTYIKLKIFLIKLFFPLDDYPKNQPPAYQGVPNVQFPQPQFSNQPIIIQQNVRTMFSSQPQAHTW